VQPLKIADWNPAKKANAKMKERGGAIMPGWWIVLPEKLARGGKSSHVSWGAAPTGNSLRVVPYQLSEGYVGSVRNSFYIHGTGGHGSDGCILMAPTHRRTLVDLVSSSDGAWLQVYCSGTELDETLQTTGHVSTTA
jgi:hypothetical protein